MPHTHNIVDDDNRFIINSETRDISNASGNKITLMQYDHNSERFTFELPRCIEGHDVRQCDLIEIKFQNVGSGTSASLRPVISDSYRVTDVSVDSENSDRATFTWLLGRTATQYAGTLSFQIKFACYEDPESGTYSFVWHTNKYTNIAVNAGLDVDEALETNYPSVLESMTARIDYVANQVVDHVHPHYLIMGEDERFYQVGADLCSESRTLTVSEDVNNLHIVKFDSTLYHVGTNELQGRWVIIDNQPCYVSSNTPDRLIIFTDETGTSPMFITVEAGTVIYPADIDVTEAVKSTILGTLEQDVADLKYVPIAITSFTSSATIAEKGSTVNTIILSWTFNKTPTVLTLDGVTMSDEGGVTYTDLGLTDEKTWILVAFDERSSMASMETKLNFYNGVYYGVAEACTVYDSAFIIALGKSGKKTLRNSKLSSFKATAETGQYIYYCQPKSFGACNFTVGGFDGGFDLVATLIYTNETEGKHQEEYYIYRSTNAGLGETTVGVK